MLDKNASKNLQRLRLIEYGYRIEDKDIETVINIIFNITEGDLQERFKNENFILEDIFNGEKAVEISTIVKDYFEIDNSYIGHSLFSKRNVVSTKFMLENKNFIEQEIKKYLVSDKLSNKFK